MDPITQLRHRFEANARRIAELRKVIEALEINQHEIGVAERVLLSLGVDQSSVSQLEPLDLPAASSDSDLSPRDAERTTVKALVLGELAKASSLTKMDIVSRLHAMGRQVNAVTVGTTLSKMVGKEVEKAGPLAYRLKGESPVGAGLSSATASVEDE